MITKPIKKQILSVVLTSLTGAALTSYSRHALASENLQTGAIALIAKYKPNQKLIEQMQSIPKQEVQNRNLQRYPLYESLTSDTRRSIVEVSWILSRWNPEFDEATLRRALVERVTSMGIHQGLIAPTLVLLDTAMISRRPEIASMLSPAIARLDRDLGARIEHDLNLTRGIDIGVDSVRARADEMLKRRGPFNINEKAKDYVEALRKLDPSGLSNAIFGPGAFIHSGRPQRNSHNDMDGFGRGHAPSRNDVAMGGEKRSPIFGMTSAEITSCASRCLRVGRDAAVTGGTAGGLTGAIVGGGAGAVFGFLAGGPIGAVSGAAAQGWAMSKIGTAAGTFGWGTLHGGYCAAHCGPSKPEPPATPTEQAPEPAPATPSTNDPQPSSPQPEATEDGPKPKEEKDGGDCKGADCAEGRVAQDDEGGGGATPDDTPRNGPRGSGGGGGEDGGSEPANDFGKFGSQFPSKLNPHIPVINPSRDFLKPSAFSRGRP